jgi:opacity protein-like surface antigen
MDGGLNFPVLGPWVIVYCEKQAENKDIAVKAVGQGVSMKKIFGMLVAVLGLSCVSQAGVLIEPYVGYDMGSSKVTQSDGSSLKQDLSAMEAGLRLGLRHRGLWLAADGNFALSGKSKPSSGDSSDFTAMTVGATLGYDFTNRLRLYAGLGLLDSVESKDSAGTKTTLYNGTPLKVGVGYWIYHHVCLNLEYSSHDYKKVKGEGYDANLSDAGISSAKSEIYSLNLSFPF